MSALTDFNTAMNAAVAEMAAGDYAGALPFLYSALGELAQIPDSIDGPSQLRWDRQGVMKLIDRCERKATAANAITGQIQRQKVEKIWATD